MKTNKKQKKWNLELVPLLAVILLVPLVVRLHIAETDLGSYPWLPDSMSQRADFFLYGKSRVLLVLAVVMLFCMIDGFLLRGKRAGLKRLLPLFGYEIFVVLSAVSSEFRTFAMHGIVEQYEGMWVLLAYGVIACYAYYVVESEKDMDSIWVTLLASGLLQGIFGLPELFGKELLDTPFMKKIMLGKWYDTLSDALRFNFAAESYQKVSGTLYNPNYAGIFFAILLFAAFCLVIRWSGWKRIYAGVTAVVSCLCLIGSGSKSAFIALLMVIVVFSVRSLLKAQKKKALLGAAGFAVIVLCYFLYDGLTGMHTLQRIADAFVPAQTEEKLTDIKVCPDRILLTWDQKQYSLTMEQDNRALYLHAYDENGEELTLLSDEARQICRLEQADFDELYFQCYRKDEIPYLAIFHNGIRWLFTDMNDTYSYITIWGKPDEIQTAAKIGKPDWDVLFTNRGYIFRRTVPLLGRYIVLGSGPDTFMLRFPQNDYVARAALGWGFFSEILTKPHCMYLQIAVQTGVISLLLFLLMPLSIWIAGLRKEKNGAGADHKSADKISDRMIINGILLIYLIAGLTNDSMVFLAPIYFVMLGLGAKNSL